MAITMGGIKNPPGMTDSIAFLLLKFSSLTELVKIVYWLGFERWQLANADCRIDSEVLIDAAPEQGVEAVRTLVVFHGFSQSINRSRIWGQKYKDHKLQSMILTGEGD